MPTPDLAAIGALFRPKGILGSRGDAGFGAAPRPVSWLNIAANQGFIRCLAINHPSLATLFHCSFSAQQGIPAIIRPVGPADSGATITWRLAGAFWDRSRSPIGADRLFAVHGHGALMDT